MTDIEIAQAAKAEHITKIAERAGIPEEYLELYGSNKAKISPELFRTLEGKKQGKLVLVTAITPTPAKARPRRRSVLRTRFAGSGKSPLSRCASRRSVRYSA